MNRFEEFILKELSKKSSFDRKIAERVLRRVVVLYNLKKILIISAIVITFYPIVYILFFGVPVKFIDFILNLSKSLYTLITTGGFLYLFYLSLIMLLLVLSLLVFLKFMKQLKITFRIN